MGDHGMEKRNDILDSMKGIAIIGVILYHSGINVSDGLGDTAHAVATYGARGVQVFFIISALLIYKSLAAFYGKDRPEGKKPNILLWYKKKYIRLIPLLWLTNTAILLYMGFRPTYFTGTHGVTVFTYLTNYLLLHGFWPWHIMAININWYVGTLAIFIMIAPLCYKVVNRLWKAGVLVVVSYAIEMLIHQTIATIDFGADNHVWREFWTNSFISAQLPVLAMGVALYFVLYEYQWHAKLTNLATKGGSKHASWFFLLAQLLVCSCIAWETLTSASMYLLSLTVSVLIFLLFCRPNRLIVNPVYATLGRYSYGIYLFHELILHYVNEAIAPFTDSSLLNLIVSVAFVLAVSFVGSVILTNYYEKPVVRFVLRDKKASENS